MTAPEKAPKAVIIPRATEKAYTAETLHKYVFFVPRSASKQEIAKAIAEAFKVTVTSVRTLNRKGKATRYSRGKHAYPGITYRQDHKVAYVTVKEGDKIPVFEDGNAKKEDKKADKKADEKAEKATKKVAKSAKVKKEEKK